MFLLKSISVVKHCKNLLKIVSRQTGKIILDKLFSVTTKNGGFSKFSSNFKNFIIKFVC